MTVVYDFQTEHLNMMVASILRIAITLIYSKSFNTFSSSDTHTHTHTHTHIYIYTHRTITLPGVLYGAADIEGGT